MKNRIENLCIILLLLLWIPVSLDKLLNFDSFRYGLLNQPFADNLGHVLLYSLPLFEIGIVLLLIVPNLRKWGMLLSSILLVGFTVYIAVALLGAWDTIPCACGSVISKLSWKEHLWFNLFFLAVSVIGFITTCFSNQQQLQDCVKKEIIARQKSVKPII